MRILIVAMGKLGRDSAAALARDYAERATAAGRSLGLGPVQIIEVEARKPGKPAEAEALRAALGVDLALVEGSLGLRRGGERLAELGEGLEEGHVRRSRSCG